MPSASEVFIGKFYNLDGLSIAERRRNFYRLLNDNQSLKTNPAVVDEIVRFLTPRTFLEELFKVDLLIYYRRSNELFDIVKDGNEIFISKIVKHLWFFEQVFNDFDAEQLVNEILPCTSYSARMKILKKLSKCMQGERFDKIFDALSVRYGQFIAHKFLLGCSSTKIEQTLKEHQIKLSDKDLMILYKKNPQFITIYFEKFSGNFQNYLTLLKYLFVYDLEFYKQLDEKYLFRLQIGKRLTRRVVYSRRNDVIELQNYYSGKLNIKTVLRKLQSDSITLLNNIVINANIEDKLSKLVLWIRKFPPKSQWKLFKEFIMNRYKLDDYMFWINEDIIKNIDNSDDRSLIVKKRYLHDGNTSYIKYLNLNESIPMLKEKINLTSTIEDRKFLLRQLIETCYFHNNMEALSKIVKFFAFKHRNEDLYVHIDFLRTIKKTFGYHNLNDDIWSSIQDLFELQKLKFNRTQLLEDQIAYIEYLFNKTQQIDDEALLKILENDTVQCPNIYELQHGVKFWKYLLMFSINNADKLVKLNSWYHTEEDKLNPNKIKENNLMCYDMQLLDEIQTWNRYNPDDKILFFNYPRIVKSIKLNMLSTVRTIRFKNLINYIIVNKSVPERNEYLELFWQNLKTWGSTRCFDLLLKHEPIQIQNHLDQFLEWYLNSNECRKSWYKLKKFSHLQFDVRLIELCLKNLENKNSIQCLSMIMSGEKYQEFADKYSEITSKKLDLNNKDDVKLYKLRCQLAENFQHTKYTKAIRSVLNFCIGDYLGSALRSLYSFMYHLPENRLEPILNIINSKTVSCKKHALFLACELCDYNTVKTIILLMNQTESSQSLQKRLIEKTIQYLNKRPDGEIFECVKLSIRFTNKNDDHLLNNLIKINRLPKQYVPQYAQFIWNFLDIIKDRPLQYITLKERLLKRFNTETVEEFPLEFCQNLLEEHFLKPIIITKEAVLTFILKLLSCDNKRFSILQQSLQILDELETNDDNKRDFLLNCYDSLMSSDSVECLQVYVNYWEKLIDPTEQFTSYVMLFFVNLKISAIIQSMDIDAILEKIVEFMNDLIGKYSRFIVKVFAKILGNVLKYFINDSTDEYDYYNRLLLNNPSNISATIMVLRWLPVICCDDKKRNKYWAIRHKIETIQEPTIKIFYSLRFGDK